MGCRKRLHIVKEVKRRSRLRRPPPRTGAHDKDSEVGGQNSSRCDSGFGRGPFWDFCSHEGHEGRTKVARPTLCPSTPLRAGFTGRKGGPHASDRRAGSRESVAPPGLGREQSGPRPAGLGYSMSALRACSFGVPTLPKAGRVGHPACRRRRKGGQHAEELPHPVAPSAPLRNRLPPGATRVGQPRYFYRLKGRASPPASAARISDLPSATITTPHLLVRWP